MLMVKASPAGKQNACYLRVTSFVVQQQPDAV
jgi:hypothetical protein